MPSWFSEPPRCYLGKTRAWTARKCTAAARMTKMWKTSASHHPSCEFATAHYENSLNGLSLGCVNSSHDLRYFWSLAASNLWDSLWVYQSPAQGERLSTQGCRNQLIELILIDCIDFCVPMLKDKRWLEQMHCISFNRLDLKGGHHK